MTIGIEGGMIGPLTRPRPSARRAKARRSRASSSPGSAPCRAPWRPPRRNPRAARRSWRRATSVCASPPRKRPTRAMAKSNDLDGDAAGVHEVAGEDEERNRKQGVGVGADQARAGREARTAARHAQRCARSVASPIAKAIGTPNRDQCHKTYHQAAAMTGPYTLDPAPARTSMRARLAGIEMLLEK